jgi:hypothetical protein
MVKKDDQGPLADVPICFNRLIAGAGSFTRTFAVDVLPVPPLEEITVTEFVLTPVVVPCTLRDKVQEEPAFKVTLLSVILPATALTVPPHVLDRPFGVATTRPVGKVSVKVTPLKVVEVFGFVIVNLKPVNIGFAVNDFAITGGSMTVSVEVPIPVDAVFGPVSVEETLLLTFV